jgi:hypothetical protein
MVAIYVALIGAEGNNDFADVAPWVLAMLTPAALSLIATSTHVDERARILLLVASAFSLVIGVLSIFSLGVGFLASGAMALFAANQLPRVRQPLDR